MMVSACDYVYDHQLSTVHGFNLVFVYLEHMINRLLALLLD